MNTKYLEKKIKWHYTIQPKFKSTETVYIPQSQDGLHF